MSEATVVVTNPIHHTLFFISLSVYVKMLLARYKHDLNIGALI